jgi:putative nucleotidyltransferase with HDIG domain
LNFCSFYGVFQLRILAPEISLSRFIPQFLTRSTRKQQQIVEVACAMMTARCVVTAEHVERTAIYGDGMAEVLGLDWTRRRAVRIGALLHDLGKVGIPDSVLHKPGKLTRDEFDKMKLHPVIGAEILETVDFGCPVHDPVRWHHERYGGGGYPDGLKGNEIPLTARILSIVDTYDAVREDRPYRKAMSRREAVEVLRGGAGMMFDPELVRIFIQNLSSFERQIARQNISSTPQRQHSPELSKEALLCTPAAGLAAD